VSALTIHQLTSAARGRRLELRLSQEEVAARLGVSRRWVRQFEAGTGGARIGTVLALFELLDLQLGIDRVETRQQEGPSSGSGSFDLDAVIESHRAR